MKVKEMKELVERMYNELSWYKNGEWELVGLRFEDKDRVVGEICENSRNNLDREDEREFPEYGTDEYFEMEEMDGVSTWDLTPGRNRWLWENRIMKEAYLDKDVKDAFVGEHAYIIVGNQAGWEQTNGVVDEGELLIKEGKVAYKIY